MPTAISKKTIPFENNHEAIAVFPAAGANAEDIIAALGITGFKSVLLVIGGADSVDEKLKPRLSQVFSRGVARAAATMNAVIIDGGTKAGVMAMMGQGVADRGFISSLIGVAPLGMVNYPGSVGNGETPLDPNHSHFVLVEGQAWGNETNVIFKLVRALRSSKAPAMVLVAGGGTVTKSEALQAVRQNLPLFIVEGSGGTADEIAAAWKAKPEVPGDPVMAEIIADGRIELHLLDNLVTGVERLLIRVLGGDNVLLQSWGHFADYDLNAILQRKRFERLQVAIIVIGVVGTALALIKQVYNAEGVQTGLKNWWLYLPWSWSEKTDHWVGWWLVYYLLIVIPIILTILIAAANRFKQGNKWLLLRASAEAIKREIFRFRAKSGDYKEVPNVPPVAPTPPVPPVLASASPSNATTAAPGSPAPSAPEAPPSPQPTPLTPEQVLAQRVEDITRRVMRTEVNASALKPYDRDKGLPPYMHAAKGDDGISLLTPDRYVQVRLGDQLNYYRTKAVKHERQLNVIQWSIFIVGGLGSLLAAINRQVWIALTTAVAAALTTFLSFRQTESIVTKYNQTATDLNNVKAWWTALPPEEQAKQTNIDTLVDHTEQVLQSELDGWVQQMQNALAELRKGQEKAPETADSSAVKPAAGQAATGAQTAGDKVVGVGETPTDEQPATVEQTAGDYNVGEGEIGGEIGESTIGEEDVPYVENPTDDETSDESKPPGE
jgi:TRPM family ion channel/conflict system pore-forming effector with SLATT domain/uncharacterized protein DUF4231